MRTGVLRNYGHRPALYLFNKKDGEQEEQQPEETKRSLTALTQKLHQTQEQ